MHWFRLFLLLLVPMVVAPLVARAEETPQRQWRGQTPVELYVNVDEMSALWPFRENETGAVPQEGDENFGEYYERWQQLLNSVFQQLRPRVPRQYRMVPARTEELTAPLRIGVWVADMQTSCSAPTYYKYLWVQIQQDEPPRYATNWDDLGVKSSTIIDMNQPKAQRDRADMESWTELWGQVPYLRVRQTEPGELERRNTPHPVGADEPGAEAPAETAP